MFGYFYKNLFILRKILKISLRVLLGIVILILLFYGFLQTGMGQNWLAGQITSRFSKELQTKISIKHVDLNLFNFGKMDLEGVMVEDQKNDTLLYAGKFQVRITDWFFFRNRAELKYVGLEDAVIRLNRKDSIWNYAFLEKYFSSTDTSAKKKAGIAFNLKKVVLKNVSFIKKDAWLGNDLYARVGGLNMDARKITISDQTIDVSNLNLDNPYFSVFNYTGKFVAIGSPVPIQQAVHSTMPHWKISFGNVTINNGRFRSDNGSMIPATTAFDGAHIDFDKINGSLKNIGWSADTLKGAINLSTQERSGLVIKTLKANTTIQPKAMIFEQLHLETNRSVIGDYFSMRYNNISDISNFIHAVTLHADFEKAKISSDDIAFFAPSLKTWKKNIKIDGDIKGTVDALSSKNLEIWAGNSTYVHGSVSLVGLPNINETLINIDAEDLRTTYRDAVNFIPAIKNIQTPALNKLTYLRLHGTYTGFITDFVLYGTAQTNLGTLQTDLNMKFPKNGVPVYAGKIVTNGFQLGQFINSDKLGLVGFHGTVKGSGFQWQTLNLNVDGRVHSIQYGNYVYHNITAKGNFTDRLFNGEFDIKDANADMHLKGLIDLTGKIPLFKATANIVHADLKAIGLTQGDFQLNGKFDLNLQASSLSDMIGTAKISEASLVNNGKRLSFDSLAVNSYYENGLKKLSAVSNEFNATITGNYDLKGLPDAFMLLLHRYYPSYIKQPRSVTPQIFTFDITTGVVEEYINLIDSRLTGFNNSHITGSLNTTANTMTVDADVPGFQFKQYHFSGVQLKGNGNVNSLTLSGQVANAQIGDSLLFPQTTFSINAHKDVSDVTINTTSNQAINTANLSAQIKTYSDGASIVFNPSSFVLNSKTWTLERGGELNFRKNTIIHGGVTFSESNQQIRLWTEPDAVGDWNNLRVAFQNVNIGDFSPFLTKAIRIEGMLNGDATVEDPEKRFDIHSNLTTNGLRLDNDSIGDAKIALVYDNKTGLAKIKLSTLNPEHNVVVDASLNLKDSVSNQLQVHSHFTNFQLTPLNRFLSAVFSDIKGSLTGDLDITTNNDGTQNFTTSNAKIHDASFKVNFTQVTYKIDDAEVHLEKDFVNLNNLRIRDQDGNTAIVKGGIKHKGFQNMNYDIEVETESPQFQLINTTINDNQEFFGTAKGTGSFVLVGTENDLHMEIDLKASDQETSYITLPPSRTRETGDAGFMVERKYGREMSAQSARTASNLTYNIHLTANPKVNVGIILDDLTGDAIRGRGNGSIRISAGTYEPLNIQGRYDIAEGDYNFTFQSLLKRPFELKKGGNNYIIWNGDPYNANVHLEAFYTAQKVSFAPLVNSGLLSSGIIGAGVRDDVNVLATLTGNLFRPNFDFRLDFPNTNSAYNTPDFQLAIQQIEKNQNELNKQVAYLIVFNSFAPYENLSSAGVNPYAGELTYNTISGLLFGKVNEELNRILSKILPNNATFSFSGSLYNRNAFMQTTRGAFALPNQSNIGLSLGLPLNNRVHITLGGTFDVPLQSNYQTTIRLFPDVALDLLLNKSGSIKATFFYKQNIDFLAGATPGSIVPRRYGASVSYGRDFDNLSDLFGKPLKKAKVLADSTIQKPKLDSTKSSN